MLPVSTFRRVLALLGALPALALAQAGPGFDTATAAFTATFISSGIARRSYDENREYSAALYQMRDGRWYSTAVIAGGQTSCRIAYDQVPEQAVRVAGVHTHGRPHLFGDADHEYGTGFSRLDIRNALFNYRATGGRIDSQWLLTSKLEVLEMSIGLGYDPAASHIGVQASIRDLGSSDRLAADGGLPPALAALK